MGGCGWEEEGVGVPYNSKRLAEQQVGTAYSTI
ncbi:hypothetical protein Hamer_G030212 [Homarus americanus]|uniref:Uncharacterized protein n=1 Tax=Homarus americanus TaxID=6706 RepID=A0A8J5K4W0_HOMAM|nr:hypothetical protein Hamer_G030212 [Homarus americanus]